jgi:hypothetical protein
MYATYLKQKMNKAVQHHRKGDLFFPLHLSKKRLKYFAISHKRLPLHEEMKNILSKP